jgi:hypothetical protein
MPPNNKIMPYIIRSLTSSDEAFLWEMSYHDLYVPPGAEPLPKEIIYRPELARYVEGWQTDDIGFVAVSESSLIPIGADLLDNIKNVYTAISLSVSLSNPALQLYQRLGFEVAAQLNDSLIMRKELDLQYTCK